MTAKTKVLEWIHENFEVGQITVKDFKGLPGGTRVIDNQEGEILVFYDYLNEKVKYSYSGQTEVKTAI